MSTLNNAEYRYVLIRHGQQYILRIAPGDNASYGTIVENLYKELPWEPLRSGQPANCLREVEIICAGIFGESHPRATSTRYGQNLKAARVLPELLRELFEQYSDGERYSLVIEK